MSGNDSFSKKVSYSTEEDPSEHGYESDDSVNRPHPDEAVDDSLEEDLRDTEIQYLRKLIELYEERMALDDKNIMTH